MRYDIFPVVGMRFRPQPYVFDGSETRIDFVPEPSNPHDSQAICVLIDGIRHVGYVARTHLAWLHQILPGVRSVQFEGNRGLAAMLRVGYEMPSPPASAGDNSTSAAE